jgi:hypothetical protein
MLRCARVGQNPRVVVDRRTRRRRAALRLSFRPCCMSCGEGLGAWNSWKLGRLDDYLLKSFLHVRRQPGAPARTRATDADEGGTCVELEVELGSCGGFTDILYHIPDFRFNETSAH